MFVQSAFEAIAVGEPHRVALVSDEQSLTYGRLDALAGQLAGILARVGAGPETAVAVRLDRGAPLLIALLAVLKSRGVYVPISPDFPEHRSRLMAEQCGARVLVTAAEVRDAAFERRFAHVVDVRAVAEGAGVDLDTAPESSLLPGQLAYITYTSGSSGAPKAVGTPHHCAAAYLDALTRAGHIRRDDVALHLAAPTFDASIRDCLGPLSVGARLVLLTGEQLRDPEEVRAALVRHRVTSVLGCGPAMLRFLTADAWPTHLPRPALRRILVSGEALSPATVRQARDRFGPVELVNHYGPTECTMTTTFHLVEDEVPERIPVGHPRPGTVIHVLDDDLAPVPTGEVGQIFIGGVGVTRGYLNSPALTAGRFLPDPLRPGRRMYRTGDLGRLDERGVLHFHGRADDQIKVHGIRVEPAEVEAVLQSHPEVRDAAIRLVSGPDESSMLCAYLVPPVGRQELDTGELRAFAERFLPAPQVPARYMFLPALPRTSTGKIDRRALPDPSRIARGGPVEAGSAAPDEAELLAIWRGVLRNPALGPHDDLFAMGGDSLVAMRLVAHMRRRWGYAPEPAELFRTPTVAKAAALLRDASTQENSILPAAGRGDTVSPAQERLWFFENLLPGSPLNTIPVAFEVREGRLDDSALRAAVDSVLARHPLLRSRFAVQDGRPAALEGCGGTPVSFEQVTTEALPHRLRELLRAPLDLAEGPLCHVAVLESPERTVLLFRVHHLIADAWSLHLLFADLGSAYGLRAGPPPGPTYADYCSWQRSWLTPKRVEREMDFWRGELLDAPLLLPLPADRPRRPVQRHRGSTLRTPLQDQLLRETTEFARRERVTVFMVLLAAWTRVLHEYTGARDIVIGVAFSGRTRAEFESVVGLFVNVLPVRVHVDPGMDFPGLVRRVRECVLRVLAHQDFPFERLVQELQPPRNLSHHPVFQVLADFQTDVSPKLGELGLAPLPVDTATARFDLSVSFRQRADALTAVFTYDTDLFDATTAERLAAAFEDRLREGVSGGAAARAVPAVRAVAQPSFHDPLTEIRRHASRTPDRTAVVSGGGSLTYAELCDAVDGLAAWLRAQGVGPGSLVGVCRERVAELVVGLLGVLAAGAAYVPLDPADPEARLAHILRDAAPDLVLTDPVRLPPHGPSDVRVGPDALAYVIYTSGSTGTPKGVEVTRGALGNVLMSVGNALDVSAEDVLVAVTTASFDIAALELMLPLMRGARLVVPPRETVRDPRALRRLLADVGSTVVQATPSMWGALLDAPGPAVRLRAALCGGEALPPALAALLREVAGSVYNMYGPTETTIWSTMTPVDGSGEISIGSPIDHTGIMLLDDRLEPVPAGASGEIYIGGAGLARGYHGRPGLTAARFVPNPWRPGLRMYRTGDRARRRADGRLEFLGRVDRQIKLRGYRIEPGEVEHVLCGHPSVAQAVVTVADDSLVAHVVTRGPVSVKELRGFTAERLPAHFVPGHVVVLDALPLTSNGKVDVGCLPGPGVRAPEGAPAPPETGPERTLADIWAAALKLPSVGAHDDFFELGGHSLLAIQVVARVNATFGTELGLAELFVRPTVRGLAQAVEEGLIQQILEEG
ncbi:amino acid adenylation domain-containing protein [Streptomyces sp. NPDC050803]|uniref:amino acid adenylation domain-containing protein n=1 Tax=unclassified Streptomyces TaxID=2593676 RepID=UPI00341A8F13